MYDYEKLGSFYLGNSHALDGQPQVESPVLYDAKDLCTHAVIVGMTGSGKTGLGVTLLEEAATFSLSHLRKGTHGLHWLQTLQAIQHAGCHMVCET